MKSLNVLFVMSFVVILSACSGGGGEADPIKDIVITDPTGPDFTVKIDPHKCINSFRNPFGKPDYFEEELASAIRSGDAACAKKSH